MLYLSSVVLGTIAGFIGGAFGLAGSVLLVPALVLLKILPTYSLSIGTVLFAMLPPTSLFAVLEFHRQKKINYKIGAVLIVTVTLATYLGAYCNKFIAEHVVKYVSSFILFALAIGMFYSGYIDSRKK